MRLTAAQIRAARAAAKLSVRTLAESSGVSPNTIVRLEQGYDALGDTWDKVRRTLEEAGVEFGEDGWVRLRKED